MAYTSYLTFPSGFISSPIQVESLSFGEENPNAIGSQNGGAGAGKVTFSPLVVTKYIDGASPTLFLAAASGQYITGVDLNVYAPGATSPTIAFKFRSVFITALEYSGNQHAGPTPLEQVTIEYGQLGVVSSSTPTGSAGISAGWDRVKNQQSPLTNLT